MVLYIIYRPIHAVRTRAMKSPGPRNPGGSPWSGGTSPLGNKDLLESLSKISRFILRELGVHPIRAVRMGQCEGLTRADSYLRGVRFPCANGSPQTSQPRESRDMNYCCVKLAYFVKLGVARIRTCGGTDKSTRPLHSRERGRPRSDAVSGAGFVAASELRSCASGSSRHVPVAHRFF